jgi:hypothetical protein
LRKAWVFAATFVNGSTHFTSYHCRRTRLHQEQHPRDCQSLGRRVLPGTSLCPVNGTGTLRQLSGTSASSPQGNDRGRPDQITRARLAGRRTDLSEIGLDMSRWPSEKPWRGRDEAGPKPAQHPARSPCRRRRAVRRRPDAPAPAPRESRLRNLPGVMAKILSVLGPDPVSGYSTSYARDDIPKITSYPDGPTPDAAREGS